MDGLFKQKAYSITFLLNKKNLKKFEAVSKTLHSLFVCYACSLSIGFKSRTGLFWREPLVDGKGAYREAKSERSLKQKLVLTNRNCILRLTRRVIATGASASIR